MMQMLPRATLPPQSMAMRFFFAACACCLSSIVGASEVVNVTKQKRRTIRIAYLFGNEYDIQTLVPIRFMMSKFANSSILPDFDVVVDPYNFTWYSGDSAQMVVRALGPDTPTYHAFAGPWTKSECRNTVDLTAEARVLHVIQCDNSIFTDHRADYPYMFRASRSNTHLVRAILALIASNAWYNIASVWLESDSLETSLFWTEQYMIQNYALLAQATAEEWLATAWQNTAVDLVRTHRLRVVVTQIDEPQMYGLACRVHRNRISGMQYFTRGSYPPGWYLSGGFYNADELLGDCTPDEMYIALQGHIGFTHVPFAPGSNVAGLRMPVLEQDSSQVPLTCMPGETASSFYNGEHFVSAWVNQAFTDLGTALIYLATSGIITDIVCSIVLALHNALYEKKVALEDIESRTPEAFEALMDSVSKVKFEGPTGHFEFYENFGDPQVIYYALVQYALPIVSNYTLLIAAVAEYPNGPDAGPKIHLTNGNQSLIWHDGSAGMGPKPHLELFPRCADVNGELIWDHCVPCPPGTTYDALLDACRACAPGTYQNLSGTRTCVSASPGYFVDPNSVSPPTTASLCPRGHKCPQSGMAAAVPCEPGSFTSEPGQAKCTLCPRGTYKNESAAEECDPCNAILGGSTTSDIASVSSADCVCPEGTYLPATITGVTSFNCTTCPEGMLCGEGSDMRNFYHQSQATPSSGESETFSMRAIFPVPQRGYMTLTSQPLTVYLCAEVTHCPGGAPGSCASRRDSSSVACSECTESAYDTGESCRPCDDGIPTAGVIFIFLVVSIVVIAVVSFVVSRNMHLTSAASIMFVAVGGMLLSSFQSVGVFNQIDIPWSEPARSILRFATVLSFDLRPLKLGCIVGADSVRSFAIRQCLAIFALPWMVLTLLAKHKLKRIRDKARARRSNQGVEKFDSEETPPKKRRTYFWAELCNAVGSLYSLFFISITVSAVSPLICYSHPGDSGDSVKSAPSVLCFQGGDHTVMVLVGAIAACCVPLPFFCLCCYGIRCYPYYTGVHHSNTFLRSFRFLFIRFKVERYYFHVFVLLRSLLVCLIPAVVRGGSAPQLLLLCTVFGAYLLLVEELRPWRAELCTRMDALLSFFLLFVLICGCLFLNEVSQARAVANVVGALIIASVVLAIGVAFYALWQLFAPSARFDFFICHHKAHAAAQARYLKTVLHATSRRKKLNVFIDSDDLQELDTLFDTVRSKVKHLVVHLTADTLKRPWCAGEIVTALRARILVTRLQTPSFSGLSTEQLEDLESYVDSTGCNLKEYSIQWDDVAEAFRHFLSSGVQELFFLVAGASSLQRFAVASSKLLRQPPVTEVQALSLTEVADTDVLISCDPVSDEASAAAGILAARIAPELYSVCHRGICLVPDYEPDLSAAVRLAERASGVVAMLTAGCLHQAIVVAVMCEAMSSQTTAMPSVLISVNTPGFEFPPMAFLGELPRLLPEVAERYSDVADILQAFFKRISVFLPTHASQHALDTQCDEVTKRVRHHMSSPHGFTAAVTAPRSSLSGSRSGRSLTQVRSTTFGSQKLTQTASSQSIGGQPSDFPSTAGSDRKVASEKSGFPSTAGSDRNLKVASENGLVTTFFDSDVHSKLGAVVPSSGNHTKDALQPGAPGQEALEPEDIELEALAPGDYELEAFQPSDFGSGALRIDDFEI